MERYCYISKDMAGSYNLKEFNEKAVILSSVRVLCWRKYYISSYRTTFRSQLRCCKSEIIPLNSIEIHCYELRSVLLTWTIKRSTVLLKGEIQSVLRALWYGIVEGWIHSTQRADDWPVTFIKALVTHITPWHTGCMY